MNINELLDTAKKEAGITSDYALAKALGMSNAYIAHWRSGEKHPSVEAATKLATLAKRDALTVIGWIEMQTAKKEKSRDYWKRFLKQHGAVASVIGAAALLLSASHDNEASVLQKINYVKQTQNFALKNNTIHIMRSA